MLVFLLRHAHTAGNLDKRYIGRTDEPLCAAGLAALRLAGTFPQITRVSVSPLCRARETARSLFPSAEQIVRQGLREMDFGDFEGRTAAEMTEDAAYRTWVESGCLSACPNGESLAMFSARTCSAFEEAVMEALRRGDEHLVIVAHGGTIMAVMERYARPCRPAWNWSVLPLLGYRACLDEKAWPEAPALIEYNKLEVIVL
jgi:alpha-ribazole phosphatase